VVKSVNNIINLGIPEENIKIDASMAGYTSFRTGGNAAYLIVVDNKEQLKELLKYVNRNNIDHMLIGNGSNLLFRDGTYEGVVIKLGNDFKKITVRSNVITVGASSLLSQISSIASENSLMGFEFASGIPGSLGGGLYMNAGAYGGEIKDVVITVNAISPDGKNEYVFSNENMEFKYRNSVLQKNRMIVTSAVIKLSIGEKADVLAKVSELVTKRNSKQPVNFPSAGSTFKRPLKGYAAQLIDEAGLKGLTVGGAQVSEKHAGFIINTGKATATDIIQLIKLVQNTVYDNSGILLEPEVRII
jgi:UDP-N-acetylmuramate dehydrogenase